MGRSRTIRTDAAQAERTNDQMRTCEKCGEPGAKPYNTRAYSTITSDPATRQPHWLCVRHKPRKEVMFDGQPKTQGT